MRKFAQEIQRAMLEKNLRQVDIEERSKGKVSSALIFAIFKRGSIPRKEVIDELSNVLGLPSEELRLLAIRDSVERDLQKLDLKWEDLMGLVREEKEQEHKVPLFSLRELKTSFNEKGIYTKKPAASLKTCHALSPLDYAVKVTTAIISPHVLPGGIAVFSPAYKSGYPEDYGIVRTKNAVHLGRIIESKTDIYVDTSLPFTTTQIPRREALYIHKLFLVLKGRP